MPASRRGLASSTNLSSATRWFPKGDVAENGKYSGRQPSQPMERVMVILPSINRRQLMTATATIAVAGLAPNPTPAEGLANSAVAQPTEPLVPPAVVQAGNFDSVTILRLREIAQRNRIRQEAGLPLLLVPKELRRMKEAADAERFRKFSDAHCNRVQDKMLARARRRSRRSQLETDWYALRRRNVVWWSGR